MREPLVSVIIPAYNCANVISDAIDSALCQDVNKEILVINDCSPDDLDRVMERYQKNTEVLYLQNEINLGASGTRNRGMKLARGKYIAFLDADDYWVPGKLSRQLNLMESTGTVLSCTARELMTPEGVCTGKILTVQEEITYRDLLKQNPINCSSVVVVADVAREFPMQHEDSHEDYIMWLRILQKYKRACAINEPLLKYRLTTTGKSGSKWKSAKMTWKVYRYMGFNPVKSLVCFCSYVFQGVKKYYFSKK